MAREGNPAFAVRIDAERRARWQKAADAGGWTLTDFVRRATDLVVENGLLEGKRYTGPDPKDRSGKT